MKSKKAFEEKLNILIGLLLSKELGMNATSETIERGGRIDVTVFCQGLKIAVEGSYQKSDAEMDASKRVEKELSDVGIALQYVEKYSSHATDDELLGILRNSNFEAKLIIPEDISGTLTTYLIHKKVVAKSVTEWSTVNLSGLARMLNEAIQYIVSEVEVQEALNEVEKEINDFIESLKSCDLRLTIAKKLYDIFYKLYGLSVGTYSEIRELIYAKTALTLLLSSAFYQSMQATHGLDNPYFINNKTWCQKWCKNGFRGNLRHRL